MKNEMRERERERERERDCSLGETRRKQDTFQTSLYVQTRDKKSFALFI
jgi:hypothetical protein